MEWGPPALGPRSPVAQEEAGGATSLPRGGRAQRCPRRGPPGRVRRARSGGGSDLGAVGLLGGGRLGCCGPPGVQANATLAFRMKRATLGLSQWVLPQPGLPPGPVTSPEGAGGDPGLADTLKVGAGAPEGPGDPLLAVQTPVPERTVPSSISCIFPVLMHEFFSNLLFAPVCGKRMGTRVGGVGHSQAAGVEPPLVPSEAGPLSWKHRRRSRETQGAGEAAGDGTPGDLRAAASLRAPCPVPAAPNTGPGPAVLRGPGRSDQGACGRRGGGCSARETLQGDKAQASWGPLLPPAAQTRRRPHGKPESSCRSSVFEKIYF